LHILFSQKDDKNSFFTVDKPKEAIKPGGETIVTFKFNPPQKDETIVRNQLNYFELNYFG
jgi:hypothetical protein